MENVKGGLADMCKQSGHYSEVCVGTLRQITESFKWGWPVSPPVSEF